MKRKKYKIAQKNWKSKLARYLHSGGYGKLAGGFATPKSKADSLRFKRIYIVLGILFFVIGLIYTIF